MCWSTMRHIFIMEADLKRKEMVESSLNVVFSLLLYKKSPIKGLFYLLSGLSHTENRVRPIRRTLLSNTWKS